MVFVHLVSTHCEYGFGTLTVTEKSFGFVGFVLPCFICGCDIVGSCHFIAENCCSLIIINVQTQQCRQVVINNPLKLEFTSSVF